jgi:hypothetical protein
MIGEEREIVMFHYLQLFINESPSKEHPRTSQRVSARVSSHIDNYQRTCVMGSVEKLLSIF